MSQIDSKPERKHRAVRSFVRRAGRLTTSQQRALDELWPDFGVDIENPPQALDLAKLFGRDAPKVLEIGFGNGDSLVELAAGHPEQDYVGVEVHEPGVGHCLIGIREAGINNLRLVMHDAIEILGASLPEKSLNRINLYFPDPWPKKRHHKRRIVQEPFLALCARALKSGGALHIATDWENYAEHIDEVLQASEWFTCTERREHAGDEPLDRPGTKFERRGLKEGHRIWDWSFACVK